MSRGFSHGRPAYARADFPEAAVGVARLSGLAPVGTVGALCGLVSRDDPRKPTGREELIAFAREHGLRVVAVPEIVDRRRRHGPGAA
ncbi:3,4-dihydroxy-2-butanone-4-phosphate synthase [Streptomyces sp. NPDC051018]|uniref:3,4-dihydroxy-2-butanone-4-phosphate synthase n=1 Tax=Streptomyces sp. NPDC051018 TaxID=3365639 RepID=UPI0037A94223